MTIDKSYQQTPEYAKYAASLQPPSSLDWRAVAVSLDAAATAQHLNVQHADSLELKVASASAAFVLAAFRDAILRGLK